MKTIVTTLPIYNSLVKQYYRRCQHAGYNKPVAIVTPQYRLPAFQWLDNGDGSDHVDKIELIDINNNVSDITTYFNTLPISHAVTGDVYFYYNGGQLLYWLPCGFAYLKITMNNNYIYYSEWFFVNNVYKNEITAFSNTGYETLNTSGTEITSMINSAADGLAISDAFTVYKGEQVTVMFTCNKTSGTLPTLLFANTGVTLFDSSAIAEGVNGIELTSTWAGDAYIIFNNVGTNVNCQMTEVLVKRDYSTKYLRINFDNTCDLGDILYHSGFAQSLWLESETMENSYPTEEEGQKNGEGRFIRTMIRQIKKYIVRTKEMPDYMVEVFNKLKLHDDVELINLIGDVNDLYNIEVDHEWMFDDKYYAKVDLTFDYNESALMIGCCTDIP